MSGALALRASQPADKTSDAERTAIERNFALLPLRFEPNQGQSSSDARFLAQGRGFSALFKENEADFLFAGHAGMSGLVRVTLLNASRNAAVSGEKRLPGTANYLIGNDREKWHTGVPTFGSLRYANVYPGTDLIYYGKKDSLEFDFQLSPGADPSRIQMRFEGARNLKIDGNGDLIVTANGGRVSLQRPVIYQPAEGGRRDLVAGCFKILEKNKVRFIVSRYDRTRPLIIDPILNYSTYFNGIGASAVQAIAVDAAGEAYVTGRADSGLPTTVGSFQSIPVWQYVSGAPPYIPPFVAKFNSTGTALLYCTYLSGTGIDTANGIALNPNGDAFVVGSTSSTDFPITTGALQTKNNASGTTGFVTELNSTGTSLLYSTFLGGSSSTSVNQVAIDAPGNAYLAGSTKDTNFPTTLGAYRTAAVTKTTASSGSAFVAKLNPTGTALVYASYLGGNQTDAASAIALDSAGEAYVGGNTTSTNFPVTRGAIQAAREASNQQAGFVTKFNASGSALVYSTYLGGSAFDSLSSIALDSNGDAYATGNTNSPDFPVTSGTFQSKIGISSFGYPQFNAFVSELNSAGTSLVYSTFLGGGVSLGPYADEGDGASGIAVDGQGMVYVTGTACTGDFPVTAGAFELQNLDGEYSAECTAFLTKMNPAPNTPLLYSTFFGGTGNTDGGDYFTGEQANGLAIDPSSNVYLAGDTLSVDFPTTAGVFETPFTGPTDEEAFVTEFNGSEMKTLPVPTVSLTSNASSPLFGQPVTFTAAVQPASGNNAPTGYAGFNFFQREASDDEGSGFGFGPWTTVALNGSGVATFTTSSFTGTQNVVIAHYLGDAENAPSTGTMTQVLTPIPTTTTLASSANPAAYGTAVAFAATVLDSTGKPGNGFVAFSVGNGTYAQVDVNTSGQAIWINGMGGPPLPIGTNTITAQFFPYSGGYQKSSGTIAETFTPLGTTPNPTFTPPAGAFTSAQQVALSDANSAAAVYYTTNGSTPVPGVSPQFINGLAIPVSVSETISSVAAVPGYSPSSVVSAAYTINLPSSGFTTGPGATTAMTVTPGSTSGNSGTVSVVGTNGFSGAVSLTCSVTTAMTLVNDMPTCSLNPVSVSLSGTAAQTATLTVNTTAASSAENRTRILFWVSPGGTALALAVFFGGFRRRRTRWAILGLFALLVSAGVSACGGAGGGGGGTVGGGSGANSGTTPGTYTIAVTGASAGMSSTVGTVALTVQ